MLAAGPLTRTHISPGRIPDDLPGVLRKLVPRIGRCRAGTDKNRAVPTRVGTASLSELHEQVGYCNLLSL